MKTLIAAGLAASALVATTAASANPVYPVGFHHPIHRAVMLRGPVVYRGGFPIAPIYARPVVYREGFFRPGIYRTAYRAPYHTYGWGHRPVNHHIAWRGTYVGEHRPA